MTDEQRELEQVVLTDDEGNEAVCLVLARLDLGGQTYVVVVDPVEAEDDDDDDEAGSAGILRVEVDDNGEEQWITVDDDAEWQQVAQAWAVLVGVEDEEE